jgi:tetratricopeptide (TPR) repeat protein
MKWSLPIRAATLFLAATAIVVSWHRLSFDAEFVKLLDATNQRPTTARPSVPPLSEKRLDAMLAKCAEIAPYSPFPILGAVNHLMATRRWAKAEFLLKKALKLSPRRSSTYYKLYVVEKHLGKRGEALRNLEKAAELFPNAYGKILDEEKKGVGLTPDGR